MTNFNFENHEILMHLINALKSLGVDLVETRKKALENVCIRNDFVIIKILGGYLHISYTFDGETK